MENYILRAAVNGKNREELCNNLISLAEEIKRSHMPLERDNAIGDEIGYSFDYQISRLSEKKIVSIGFHE